MNKKTVAVGVLSAAAILVTGGCLDKAAEPWNDAKISHKDDSPAEVYSMPDGFNNVASKCDGHGHRFFTLYHADSSYGSVTVIADSTCQK